MNNKELIASELAKVIDSLDQDAILNLLEQPKSSDLGDIAFPAFSLAKWNARLLKQSLQILLKRSTKVPSKSRCNWTLRELLLRQI